MPYVTQALEGVAGPVVAVSDWMRAVPDQISRWVPTDYTSLGTDGFGFADTRGAARRFFHVDAPSIVVAVLEQLAARGEVKSEAAGRGDRPVRTARRRRRRHRQPGGRRRLTAPRGRGRRP